MFASCHFVGSCLQGNFNGNVATVDSFLLWITLTVPIIHNFSYAWITGDQPLVMRREILRRLPFFESYPYFLPSATASFDVLCTDLFFYWKRPCPPFSGRRKKYSKDTQRMPASLRMMSSMLLHATSPPSPHLLQLHHPYVFEYVQWRSYPSDVFNPSGVWRPGIESLHYWDYPQNLWPDKHHFPGQIYEASDTALWVYPFVILWPCVQALKMDPLMKMLHGWICDCVHCHP